ncbi:hypothetical protein ACJVC5_18240 [Peredibacter sp. HCB2-198]|uniref:hypothetical protein n=1 Tax=Peredibacter sp. HCB2-198 TaxID=3383025 RepID=UPI0038B64560
MITPLIGSIVHHKRSFPFLDLAYAAICTDPVYAKLYRVESDGGIQEDAPLKIQLIESDARYSFDLSSLDHTSKVNYVVKVEGCNGEVYERPVTNLDDKQDVDIRTTLVAQVLNVNAIIPKKMNEAERKEVDLLINSIQGSSPVAALNSITTDLVPSSKFTEIFGTDPSIILSARPEVYLATPSSDLSELNPQVFNSRSFHIDPSYAFVYRWRLNGMTVASTKNWTFTPTGNQQGQHQIDYYVGKDDGSGNIDLTRPYYVKSFTVNVINNVMATAPLVSIDPSTPSPRVSNNVTLSLNTGIGLSECDSFSKMAVTESSATPGPLQFTIDCVDPVSQLESVVFSPGDGAKTLYLWARDASGNISSPRIVNLVLDTTAPTTSLSLSSYLLKGGSTQTLTLSGSDPSSGLTSLELYYADDGVSYSLVSSLTPTATSYNWTVPLSNTTAGKLKIVATDSVGLTSETVTSGITIDSLAPIAPSVTRTSLAMSSSPLVSMTIGSCTDTTQIVVKDSNVQPSLSDPEWQLCTTASGGVTVSVSGDGAKNLYVWARDEVGNIASSANGVSMTLDTTQPVISAGPTAGTFVKGGLSTTITWTVIDTTTTLIDLEFFDGSAWSSLISGEANSGSYSWSAPTLDINNAKLRLTATDQVGNSSQVSSENFVIQTTPPSVSNLTITQGAATNLQNIQVNMGASDVLTNVTHFCLKLNSPVQPVLEDSCWRAVNANPPAIAPALNINFSNFYYQLGFTTGSYTVYGFTKNASGLVSSLSNSGNGTEGMDMATIFYTSSPPPSVSNVIASNTDTPLDPIDPNDYVVSGGGSVIIKWKATDSIGLGATPMTIEYTLDGKNYLNVASNLSNGSNGGCTPDNGATTLDDGNTGCYTWSGGAPGSYFAIRVRATNTNLISGSAQGNFLNSGKLRTLAGNVDSGINGSAKSAMIRIRKDVAVPFPQQFVVLPDGKIVIIDTIFGLTIIEPLTGLYTVLIPNGAATSTHGDGGPISAAKVKNPSKITIDHSGNIYFWDDIRIRKIVTSTNPWTINTIIGGGANVSGTNIPGTDLMLSTLNRGFLQVRPDGKVWFVPNNYSANFNSVTPPNIYSYDPVTSLVTNHGSFGGVGDMSSSSRDLTGTRFGNDILGLSYDQVNSNTVSILGCIAYNSGCVTTRFNPTTFQANPSDPLATPYGNYLTTTNGIVTGLDGRMYVFSSDGYIRKWNDVSTITTIVGNGRGNCIDGTPANSCKMNLNDIFVDSSGKVYFMESGLIRTLDTNNNVITLAGQNLAHGDGLKGTDARFGTVRSLTVNSQGDVAILDSDSFRIRKWSKSTKLMSLLAGDGRNVVPNTTAPSNTQSIAYDIWVNTSAIATLPGTDEVVYSRGNAISKIDAVTGKWVDIAGGGSTLWTGADGLGLGSVRMTSSYYPKIVGVSSTSVLTVNTAYLNGYIDNMLKSYDTATGVQSHFAGLVGLFNGTGLPADGTTLATAYYPGSSHIGPMTYDSVANAWYTADSGGGNKVRKLIQGGSIDSLFTDPGASTIISVTSSRASGSLVVYYCADVAGNYRLKKWSEATSTITTLAWPTTSINCLSKLLNYDPSTGNLIFGFSFGGLQGVAEYRAP